MDPASVLPAALVAGRYEIEQEIARGGMGVVYRAKDRVTGATIALKRSLSEHESTSQITRSMLQREYQTLVTLRHPHIIQVHDFGVDEVGPYYTMELLDGSDLRSKCPLPWRDVCAYMRDVASSLALLHSRRLLHCDVSVANIRLTLEGRAKLLDFGTLASFGRASVIAGAPPIIPPEVLERQELDQRVDLYALGATAYFALTGRHAYPANMLALLPTIWEQGRPAAPSEYNPDIPRELDELVLSLLDLDRMSRPASAAEVIDRLGAIAGLAPDQDQRVQRSYLHSAEVIGREVERKALEDQLKQVLNGRGGGALIAGAPGQGKSFLLEDVAQRARLAGARVLIVNARTHSGAFGVWSALIREASSHVDGARPSQPNSDAVFFKLAESMPLVLAIEDLDEADSDSLAAFATLAKSARYKSVLLLATLDHGNSKAERPAMRLLRQRLTQLELRPFDEKATLAFVKGLFGDVTAVPRLSTFLYGHAAGNPRAYTEIIHHLIREGLIRYAEGTWILPDEVPIVGGEGSALGSLADAALASRIAHWSAPVRTLAQTLSPQRRTFDLALCRALVADDAELRGEDLAGLLRELVREAVLFENQGVYAFERTRIRDVLYAQLSKPRKQELHARLAQAISAVEQGGKRGFEIGFHLLLAGQEKQARKAINDSAEHALIHPDHVIEAVPDLWALLEHQRSIGASDDDVQFIEGVLVFSGYYVDPTIHDRFGERALTNLHRTLGGQLAMRLTPWLGAFWAVTVGLLWAWTRMAFKKRYFVSGPRFKNSLLVFISVCAALSAGACFRMVPSTIERLLKLLAPWGKLGRRNAFRLTYDLFRMGQFVVAGRLRATAESVEDQLARLPRIALMTKEAREQYQTGLYFSLARLHMLRPDSQTLEYIERIDQVGTSHDRLMASLLRGVYHLYRGDLAASKREAARFDELSATIGSRWTTDVMDAMEFTPHHLAGDVLGLKRSLHRIERLQAIAPGLASYREVNRAMYEGHRGRPDLALKIYASIEQYLAPFSSPIWAQGRGHQAECLNMLGRYAEALALCEAARAHLTQEDRVFVLAYQQLERESALALAGLGRIEEAVRMSEGLIAEYAGYDNPMAKGLLHCDRARIAIVARDKEAFEQHAEAAKAAFAVTAHPALIARGKRLFELGRAAGLVVLPVVEHGVRIGFVRNVRAERILDEVVRTSGASSACLYLIVHGKAVLSAQYGEADTLSVLARDSTALVNALRDGMSANEFTSAVVNFVSQIHDARRFVPLLVGDDDMGQKLIAVIVLGDCNKSVALTQLELTQIASELVQEEDTEVV